MKEFEFFKILSTVWDVGKLEKSLQEVLEIVPFPAAGKIVSHCTKVYVPFRLSEGERPQQLIEHNIEDEMLNTDTVLNQIVLTKKPQSTSDYFRVKLKKYSEGNLYKSSMKTDYSKLDNSSYVGEEDEYAKELEYTDFIPEFNHTYFKEIYNYFSSIVSVGRIMLIRSFPQQCLSWHIDNNNKIHIPIKTNSGVKMIIEDEIIHMPAGSTTIAKTNHNTHSIMNGGETERIHLVISFAEK